MNAHRRVELRFAICGAKFCAVIKTDCQFRVVNFACLGETHSVHAGHQARPARSGLSNLCGGRHSRRLCAHCPCHSVQAGPFAGRQFINDASGRIQDFQFHFSKQMPLALIVIDHGGVRRVVTDENRVAIGPTALAFDPLLHGAR